MNEKSRKFSPLDLSLQPFHTFVELLQVFNRLRLLLDDFESYSLVDSAKDLSVIVDQLDALLGQCINKLNCNLGRSVSSLPLELDGLAVTSDYYLLVTMAKLPYLKKLVTSDFFSEYLLFEIDRQTIIDLKTPQVLFLEDIVRRSGYSWNTHRKQRELRAEALRNALFSAKALSSTNQAVLICDILDELFGFGPLGLPLRDTTVRQVFEMTETGAFIACGTKREIDQTGGEFLVGLGVFSIDKPFELDVKFDSDDHRAEILGRLSALPNTVRGDYAEYKTPGGAIFRLPIAYQMRRSRQEELFEKLIEFEK